MLQLIAYAAADRLWGSDVKHGRRWAIGVALLAGYLLDSYVGLATAVAFLAVRSLAFKQFGGSATPVNQREIVGLFIRYAIVVPMAVGIAVVAGNDPVKPVIAYGAWAACATFLGVWYGKVNAEAVADGKPIDPNANQFLEVARGAAFGLAAWLV
jgi:hypothetical protein